MSFVNNFRVSVCVAINNIPQKELIVMKGEPQEKIVFSGVPGANHFYPIPLNHDGKMFGLFHFFFGGFPVFKESPVLLCEIFAALALEYPSRLKASYIFSTLVPLGICTPSIAVEVNTVFHKSFWLRQ